MTSDTSKDRKEEKKVGVYICHCGGNISDHVDVAQLAKNVDGIKGVAVTHTNTFMCSDPGQELIQKDIKSGKIDRVVVASCAPSLHELTFRGAIKRAEMNPYLYEHANIREQVSWVHHGERATAKATALVAAAIAKARKLEPLEPVRVTAHNHATVIGGGVAGMRAALDLSRRGIRVALVERTPHLGGRTAKLTTLYPTGDSAASVVQTLAEAVQADAGIDVLTCTEILNASGYVGNFALTLRTRPNPLSEAAHPAGTYLPFAGYRPAQQATGSESESDAQQTVLQTGAVVMATGFRPYAPAQGEYGYLDQPAVMTLPEFLEETADAGRGKVLTVKGRSIRRLAFIHCVGSRQIPGIHEPAADDGLNEYCSRTCCSTILRTAVEVRSMFPHTRVLDYYRDIRTYGRGAETTYDSASENGVLFFRFEPEAPPLVEAGSGSYPLRVRVQDTLTFGEELVAEVDLVVLGVGMEATPIPSLVEMMKLPTGMDRFLQEVHPKLRPVEVANNGILLAGTCQAPMDITESCAAAQAAAAKAATLLGKGYVELDPYVAEVDPSVCSGHGDCAKVCPVEGAVTIADKAAQINPALCTGCGICVAECPENAINIKGWTLDQYEEMVDAILAA
jgi:heterodisulfide reductase subunit A